MAKTEARQAKQKVKEAEAVEMPKEEGGKGCGGAGGGNEDCERGDAGAAKTEISWEAEEYIVRDKNAGWYVGMVVVGLLLSALAIWLQHGRFWR